MLHPFSAVTPAKVNLGLEVLGRRSDGFHEIRTILQTVSIYDRFVLTPEELPFQYLSPLGIAPESDLVARALASADSTADWTGSLTLEKHIPEAAGLGGGSSDAAFALTLAHPDWLTERIRARAGALGSDVPFFVNGGTALATGTGTDLLPLPTPALWFVILVPDFAIPSKTRTLYAALTEKDFSDGEQVDALADSIRNDAPLQGPFPNAFERALLDYQAIAQTRSALRDAGADNVSVSGAGPALFTVTKRYLDAASILRRLRPESGRAFVARATMADGRQETAHQLARLIRGGHSVR